METEPFISRITSAISSGILRGFLLKWICIIIALFMAGCALDPVIKKQQEEALISHTWYRPQTEFHFTHTSFESHAVCKFNPDGTGTLNSLRVGYIKPGVKVETGVGMGAFTTNITWPFSWKVACVGKAYIKCGSPTAVSTIPGYETTKPLSTLYATHFRETITIHFANGEQEHYVAVKPDDPRINPTPAEIKNRLAYWVKEGPKLVAATDANNAMAARQPIYVLAPPPNPDMLPAEPLPPTPGQTHRTPPRE